MDSLVERYKEHIQGTLSCFDRVVLSGTLPDICYPGAMAAHLRELNIRLFDFPAWANTLRDELRENAQVIAKEAGVQIEFIAKKDAFRKEARIKQIIKQRGDHPGLVHIFSAMERCTAYQPWYDKSTGRTELKTREGKCLHYYFYCIDAELGLCYLRVPTWAPFRLQFYFNGHQWLARQLENQNVAFTLIDNAFVSIDDFERAQQLSDSFNPKRLHQILDRYASIFCPIAEWFRTPVRWTIMQVEYATDLVFRRREDLKRFYDPLIRTALCSIKAENVAKFLGRTRLSQNFAGELGSDLGTRVEGTRLKHMMANSSIKMYDKLGLVLRLETTTNDVRFFYHYRTVVHRDGGRSSTKVAPVLKTIYSLGIMARLLLAANDRYSSFLAALDQPDVNPAVVYKIARPVRKNNRSYRGFNLFCGIDLSVFLAVVRGEFTISGFRNRDLQPLLAQTGQQVSRLLTRLRLHGLIKKVARRHKYYMTSLGKRVIACALRFMSECIVPTLAQLG